MTCRDCLYSNLCRQNGTMMYYQHRGKQLMEDAEKACPWKMFKNKADYAEVVRCKDCKHVILYRCKNDPCHNTTDCKLRIGIGDENFFCSYGERRTNLSTIPTGSEGRADNEQSI